MQKKEKIQIGITGILVLVLLIAAAGALKGKKPAQRPLTKTKSAVGPVAAPSASAEEKNLFQKLEEESKGLEAKRDPFSKAVIIPEKVSTELYLSGILWDAEIPKAIIGEVIVGVGEKVKGKTVIEIQRNRVILTDGFKNFELRLGE